MGVRPKLDTPLHGPNLYHLSSVDLIGIPSVCKGLPSRNGSPARVISGHAILADATYREKGGDPRRSRS